MYRSSFTNLSSKTETAMYVCMCVSIKYYIFKEFLCDGTMVKSPRGPIITILNLVVKIPITIISFKSMLCAG